MFARTHAIAAFVLAAFPAAAADPAADPHDSAYDFHFTAIEGTPLPMEAFRGKVILVVNTASFCGFTHQYTDSQTI